jgi:HEPN domain-containing protein
LLDLEKKAPKGKGKVEYWLKSADDDWKVAKHLFERGDYSYSLFFGHLTIEKTIKAIYVDRLNDNPPFTHRLVYLAEITSLELTEDILKLLETVTDFNLEARYPDEKFSFKKRCTKEFTQRYLKEIGVLRKWLAKQIR